MSFRSTDQIEKQTNTEPLLSSGFLQCKSSFDVQTFDGGKFVDLYSPDHTFNSTSIGMSKAPGFGHDFSLIPTHSDRVRQAMPSLKTGTMVQRYSVNGNAESAPCSTCSDEGSTPISTTAEPASPAPGATATTEPEEESAAPEETAAPALIVEDSATELSSGQMRKSEFLARLRAAVVSTAESAMAGTGRTTADCPYITFWFDYYSLRSAQHVERALRRYAPEASRVTTASEYISIITQRVRRSVETWVRTGEVTGVPEGVATAVPGASGGEGAGASTGPVMRKAREGGAGPAGNPKAIQSELGQGKSLDSGVRSRMESAFGTDFSHVRTHTDTTAAGLSDRLNARAFTVGEHVAFGAGEYKPGTLFGDALIAHEMAHVVQQKGADAAPMQKGQSSYGLLEGDADRSAVGAVTSLWGLTKGRLKGLVGNVVPALRSGLRLQRCSSGDCPPGYHWKVVSATGFTVGAAVCKWRCVQNPASQSQIGSPNRPRPIFLPSQSTGGMMPNMGTCICNPPTDSNGNPYTSQQMVSCNVQGGTGRLPGGRGGGGPRGMGVRGSGSSGGRTPPPSRPPAPGRPRTPAPRQPRAPAPSSGRARARRGRTPSGAGAGGGTIPARDLARARTAAQRTIADAQGGTVRRASNYHGRLPSSLEQEILSNPSQVYVSTGGARRLIFRRGGDIVITEGAGSSRGRIVTSYGPSGPRGASGAAVHGGSPNDPGLPVTDEMITSGNIPRPDGGTEPPAVPFTVSP